MEYREIALRQIKAAARHYNKKDYVCAISLLGVAEEITGKISKRRNDTNHFEFAMNRLSKFYITFTGNSPSDKILIGKINDTKNKLKHNDCGENVWVEADFENEAVILFIRAVKNYVDCFSVFPEDIVVKRLFNFLTL